MWFAVGILGCSAIGTSVVFLLGHVHRGTRTELRLRTLRGDSESLSPTVAQYKESCMDAKYLWDAMGYETNAIAVVGTVLIVLSFCGGFITTRLSRAAPPPLADRFPRVDVLDHH
jgi:hypothetical protein